MGMTTHRGASARGAGSPARLDWAASATQIGAWVALTVVVVCLSLHGWGTFQLGVYQDDAVYVVLARSIVSGGHYGLINEPGPPGPPLFPFGFPLVLAPVVSWFPHDLQIVAAVSLAATVINIALIFWGWPLLAPRSTRWWGVAVAALYGCNPMIVAHTRMALSEPVFMTSVLLALLATEAVARGRSSTVLLGALLICTLSIRSAGIAVCFAALLRLRAAAQLATAPIAGMVGGGLAVLLLVLGFTCVDVAHLSPWRYLVAIRTEGPESAPPKPSGVRLGRTELAVRDLRRVLIAAGGGDREREFAARMRMPWLPPLLASLLACVVGVGAWRTYRTQALSASVLFFEVVYFALFVLWPWHVARLLYPIQPFLALQLVLGVGAASGAIRNIGGSHRRAAGARPVAMVATWAILVAMSCWKSGFARDTESATRDLRVGTAWLKEHAPARAIVMAHYPQSVYLYAERKTADLTAQNGAELDRDLSRRAVDYVLIGPALKWRPDGTLFYDATQQALLAALEERVAQGRVTRVYESAPDLVRVYRVERAS